MANGTTFHVRAVLDPAGVIAGSRAAKASLVGLQRQANVLGATFTRVFGIVGLGIGIKTSIDLIADFQQSIATATAIATRDFDALQGNMAALSEEARRLGRTTRYTAKEAADGMLFLARAGFDVNEVLDITKDALLLAQAGNLDLGRAADIVTNVMAGFSVEVDQATRFVDVLAKTANTTNTNIQQLGDALKFAGPVAAATGVQVEEAAAAVGALSNAGLQGTLAGTGLRRVLSELEAPSTKAQKFLARLGLKMDDVQVSTVGLVPAITKLVEAGFDVGDALEFFGDRGGPAFQVIKSAVEQGFIQRMTNEFIHAENTARDIAKVMDETLKGALFALKSAFEAVILAAGELGTAGGLEDFIRGVTQLLRNMAANIELVTKLFQVLAAVIVTLLVRKALVFLNGALVRLFAVIAANPVGALGIAFVALTAAVVAFSDQLALTEDGMVTLEHVGLAALEQLKIGITNLFADIAEVFGYVVESADASGTQVTLIILSIIQGVAQLIDGIIGGVTLIPLTIAAAWSGLGGFIKNTIKVAANFYIEEFNKAINELIKLYNKAVPKIYEIDPIAPKLFDVDETKIDNFIEQVKAAYEAGFENLPEIFGGEGGPLERALLKAIEEAPNIAAASRELERLKEVVASLEPPDIVPGDKEAIKFRVLLENLDREIMLLRQEEDVRERLKKIKTEEDTFEKGLSETQKQLLNVRYQTIQSLERQNQLYTELASGQLQALARQEQTLGELYKANRIGIQEYALALEDLRYQSLQFAQDIDSGEMRALIRVKQEIRDIASLTENVLVSAFQSVEQAIVDFVSTGEADIHRLAQTIFAETSRILLRLLLVKSLGGLIPTGGISSNYAGPFGAGLGLPFQHGGSFTVGGSGGTDSQLVPLRLTPGERVDVTPRGQTPETQAPVVNIKNVTVFDAGMMVDAISTGAGERAVLNVIQRNPNEVKKVLR